MQLVTFKGSSGYQLGVRTDSGILDVRSASSALQTTEFTQNPARFLRQANTLIPALQHLVSKVMEHPEKDQWMLDEAETELGPCIPKPGKIICVGLNYRQHAIETNAEIPTTPILFSKFNNTIAAPNEDIPLPEEATTVDYEAELGVVIGKKARYVPEDQALDYVLGYCNANDISERNMQVRTSQWLLGKTLDKFLPLGPYLVTADEVPDPQNLSVKCWFNGELRQDSNTADMIFSVAQVISYASRYMTLEPGDIISTGTPQGVILGMDPKVWMKPGDEVTVEIGDGQFGKLRNKMTKEKGA